MTTMAGPDCTVRFILINTHTHTYYTQLLSIPPSEDQCEWHRMPKMTGPEGGVMFNLINTNTHTHTEKKLTHKARQVRLDYATAICRLRYAMNWSTRGVYGVCFFQPSFAPSIPDTAYEH